MSVFEMQTNLRLSQIPANFNQKATDLIAECFEKDKTIIMCSIIANQLITFGGTSNEPGALIIVRNVGEVSVEKNRESCKKLYSFLQTELALSPTRVLIKFEDIDPQKVAMNSQLFSDM